MCQCFSANFSILFRKYVHALNHQSAEYLVLGLVPQTSERSSLDWCEHTLGISPSNLKKMTLFAVLFKLVVLFNAQINRRKDRTLNSKVVILL